MRSRCPRAQRSLIARRRRRLVVQADLNLLADARALVHEALRLLVAAGAYHAARAARRALKSADGALRHATLLFARTRPIPGTSCTNLDEQYAMECCDHTKEIR